MADKIVAPPEKLKTEAAGEQSDHTSRLQEIGNPGPPKDRAAKTADAAPEKAAEAAPPVELTKITDAGQFRSRVEEMIKEAKTGAPVSIDVDTRVAMTGADGKPTKDTQASLLYDELKKAYPDNAYVFAKPELHPGDQGYSEIPAPKVTNPEGVQLSSKENPITTSKDIVLADGSTLPSGSKFAVGAMYDGQTVKSADPEGKVWATTPEGKMVQVADAGQAAAISKDDMSSDPKSRGQLAGKDSHILVRTAGGKDAAGNPLVDPDGKALLDAYPTNATTLNENYKENKETGNWAPKAKSADHLLLPKNMTIEAETAYGHATASGEKHDYYMTSGFADAKDATAKNYSGETDPRSAKELMRIRAEGGLTGPSQVEAGLAKHEASQHAEASKPEHVAKAAEPAAFVPKGFHSSAEGAHGGQPHELGHVPDAVVKAMSAESRSPEEKAEVDKFMKEKGISAERTPEVEAKFKEEVKKGLPVLIALGAALGAAGTALGAERDKDADKVTYRH